MSPGDIAGAASTPPAQAGDMKQLAKALAMFAGKEMGGITAASAAWKITTIPATMPHQDLTNFLVVNNIAPHKAPGYAKEALEVLNNPAFKMLFVGVSAGAVTFTIVENTNWSAKKKWWTIILIALGAGLLYLLLWYLGVMV